MLFQVAHYRLFVEWFDSKTKMVDVSAFDSCADSSDATQLSLDGNEIHHRGSRTNMHQAQVISPASDLASKTLL